MPMRSGAKRRKLVESGLMMFRHRYDEVGLPCRNTMGAPEPTSTCAMTAPFTRVRFLGRAADVDTDI